MKISMPLEPLRAALGEKKAQIHEAARPAAQAGVQVIYDQARANAPMSSKGHWFHGTSFKINGKKYYFEPGTLRNAIYQVYSKDNSSESRATYHVSWNDRKAPYGFMVELGTSRAPAHSFMGKAIVEKSAQAAQAMKQTFIEKVTHGL